MQIIYYIKNSKHNKNKIHTIKHITEKRFKNDKIV